MLQYVAMTGEAMAARCDHACEHEQLSISWQSAKNEINLVRKVKKANPRIVHVEGDARGNFGWSPGDLEDLERGGRSAASGLAHHLIIDAGHHLEGCLINVGVAQKDIIEISLVAA